MSGSVSGASSKEAVGELVKHLDILCPNGTVASPLGEIDGGGWPHYRDPVKDFLKSIDDYTSKYNNGVKTVSEELLDPQKIPTANWDELIQMVQNISRADKCHFWHLGGEIEKGNIQRILLRMKELSQQ